MAEWKRWRSRRGMSEMRGVVSEDNSASKGSSAGTSSGIRKLGTGTILTVADELNALDGRSDAANFEGYSNAW